MLCFNAAIKEKQGPLKITMTRIARENDRTIDLSNHERMESDLRHMANLAARVKKGCFPLVNVPGRLSRDDFLPPDVVSYERKYKRPVPLSLLEQILKRHIADLQCITNRLCRHDAERISGMFNAVCGFCQSFPDHLTTAQLRMDSFESELESVDLDRLVIEPLYNFMFAHDSDSVAISGLKHQIAQVKDAYSELTECFEAGGAIQPTQPLHDRLSAFDDLEKAGLDSFSDVISTKIDLVESLAQLVAMIKLYRLDTRRLKVDYVALGSSVIQDMAEYAALDYKTYRIFRASADWMRQIGRPVAPYLMRAAVP
jgi:hypothetical protein